MVVISTLRLEYNYVDQPGPLLFPADSRVWATTWVNAQTFLAHFRSEYRKNDARWRYSKGVKLSIQGNRLSLFPIGY